MKKLSFIFAFIVLQSFGCWYEKGVYQDYIYSVNGIPRIGQSQENNNSVYCVTNNIVVDFPITVSMKLISDQAIDLGDGMGQSTVGNITGKLQYRVLPSGDWITVKEYDVPSGTISKDSTPLPYFGENNIWPKNCKAGDVIMIRLYVTDGMWQSGTLQSKCDSILGFINTQYGSSKLSLPSVISYEVSSQSLKNYDLGGSWYPHLVATVVYSGNTRPIR